VLGQKLVLPLLLEQELEILEGWRLEEGMMANLKRA